MHIRPHADNSIRAFCQRTVSAQLHLIGLVAAIAGLLILLQAAELRHNRADFWACLIFGLTSILVFLISTVYHFISDGFQISKAFEKKLEDADHFAIFLFIAGTYSPVLVNVIHPPWNWILLVLIWSISLAGITYTVIKARLPAWARHRAVNTSLFVAMGWTLLLRIGEAFQHMDARGTWLIVLGAVAYTAGAVVYASKKPNLIPGIFGFHELWHVMVMIGFGCHYFMILNFYQ